MNRRNFFLGVILLPTVAKNLKPKPAIRVASTSELEKVNAYLLSEIAKAATHDESYWQWSATKLTSNWK